MKRKPSLRRSVAGLCGVMALLPTFPPATAQTPGTPPTGPQQLLFAGLRASSSATSYAQFNAIQSDSTGNLYLLLDQKDGIRLLKTDPTATNILAQTQLGAIGDIGLAMALDPAGNLYITGDSTSGSLQATSGAAFPNPSPGTSNPFIGKFDSNLNEIFLTYAGSGESSVTAIAATSDAVFLTGSIFGATLPVTPSAILQFPASGSFQNGFVEKFNSTGSTLLYATYLSGQNGETAPDAITADSSDNAYIAGYTTSSGFPTLAALIPNILSATSGFLTKLTPAGDGLLFSTFIPGADITSLALAPSAQNPAVQTLLVSGAIALGQFPIASVPAPLVDTTYQSLLRLSLDGSTLLSSTLLAPGAQSILTPALDSDVWIAANLTAPASLLPLAPLSTIGNSYALRITQQNTATPQAQFQIDQAIRFGGLPVTNPDYASAPANLTSLTTDPLGQPIFAGSLSPTASSTLLSTETYDLPLYNTPTPLLPSTLSAAELPSGSCTGSLCAGSAAYLAKLNPSDAAPSLALSTSSLPNVVLRNLGSQAASNLVFTATGYTIATDCPTTLPAGGECNLALTGSGPGTLTAQAGNAAPQTASLPTTSSAPNPIVFSPKELDFGIGIGIGIGIGASTGPPLTRTITVSNLSQQPQTFVSTLGSNQITPYTFAESSSDCPTPGLITTKTLAPNASCHITFRFTASASPADDGPALSNWTIGPIANPGSNPSSNPGANPSSVLLTAYSQAASLNVSATEIDFGTQYGTDGNSGLRLPRYLYLSNNSASPILHNPVTLAPPFTLTDRCPPTLEPHTVCQLQLAYNSPIAPSADSTTLTLSDGSADNIAVLITGSTLPQPTGVGQSVNPNLTLTPASITFPNSVPVTSSSSATQTVTIGNIGAQPLSLTLALTGDFTKSTNCPALLPGNQTCSVLIAFTPTQPGTRQGLLAVATAADASPAYVSLTGTGAAILLAPNNTLRFGDVLLGQPAVLWYKITSPFSSLTVSTSAPDFKAILVEDTGYGHGQPSTAAFQSVTTGSCSNCWLGVQFTPSSTSPQTAILTLASSGSGSPAPLTLTGTGLPLTGLILTPTVQDFGSIPVHSSSAPTLFTLTNQTAATVQLAAPTLTGDFATSPTSTGGQACNGPLAPNASCFLSLLFAPTSPGTRTGTLTFPASSGPITAPLTGFGAPASGLALNPAALLFNNVPGPAATQQTITLTNTGSATLQIAQPTTATPNFTASTTTCASLAPAAACAITVAFTPTDALTSDLLQIPVTSSLNGPVTYTVPLTGAYTTEDAGLQILPAQANFGPNPTSSLGLTRQFTINNLTAKSLALNLSLPRQFVLTEPDVDPTSACAALAPYASCTFSVSFLPLTNGDITGTIFAQATPTDGSATLNGLAYLEGYGKGPGTLAITGNIIPNQNVLDFGRIASGQTSRQTLTFTNQSETAPLTIRRLTSEWPFLIASTTCGATLAPAQSCAATLTYTPLNQAAAGTNSPQPATDAGTLVIESDALSGPDFLDLTGVANPVSVAAPANPAPLVSYAASTSSLTFPATQVGSGSEVQLVTLSNTGTAVIHITALQTTPDFTVQSGCGALLPSSSCVLYITFTPQPLASSQTSASTRISALEITSDSSTALDFLSLLGDALPSPLTLTPVSLDFGEVQVGTTATLPLQITNTSPSPALFRSISTDNRNYTVAGDCPAPNPDAGAGLPPASSCTLQVSFTPSATGVFPGDVILATSLSPLGLQAALTGVGIQSTLIATPASLNFGSLAVGASANLTLTLANTGSAPISNLAFNLTGDYALTAPCPLPSLAPGQSCTVTVTFSPTLTGPRNGALTVSSSSPNSPATIPLTGTGVSGGSFLLTVDGAPSASASVLSEDPATYTLQLTPQGGFTGTVILNCTPVTPGAYAFCSLLPSSIPLNGAAQISIATINTITTNDPTSSTAAGALSSPAHRPIPPSSPSPTLLCLLPAALLFFRRSYRRANRRNLLPALCILLTLGALSLNGCGGNSVNSNLRFTPPGVYQYQITATSANGIKQTQAVTLNLTVTAH